MEFFYRYREHSNWLLLSKF